MWFIIHACFVFTLCWVQQGWCMHADALTHFKRQQLQFALFHADAAKLTTLLKEYPDLAKFRDTLHYTPLHRLASKLFCVDCAKLVNQTITQEHAIELTKKYTVIQDMIQILVAHGAEINATLGTQGRELETPLMSACRHSCALTIQTLLICDADATLVDRQKQTALHYLVANRFLTEACLPQAVTSLCKAGAPLDTQDEKGWTPLLSALLQDNMLAVTALLGAGANPNIPDSNSMMPLHYAIQKQKKALVIALLAHGAQKTSITPWGADCLTYAREIGNQEIITLLAQTT